MMGCGLRRRRSFMADAGMINLEPDPNQQSNRINMLTDGAGSVASQNLEDNCFFDSKISRVDFWASGNGQCEDFSLW